MNPRPSPLALAAALCAMSLAMMGCTDAFTVHSIVEKPNEPGAPHGMHGLWVHQYDQDSYAVLQIARVANPERPCEVAELRVWEEPAALDDAPLLEDRACLAEVAGHTVVEIGTLTKPVLYLHYLVRLESAEFSVCTLQTVWGLSRDIARDDASQAELAGLDYTIREADKYEQIFLISDEVKLRAYLEANLSRVVEKCDETDGHWEVFKRVTPELSPTPGEADEESGDEPPAAAPLP